MSKIRCLVMSLEIAISIQEVLLKEHMKSLGESDPYIEGIIKGLNAALEQVRFMDESEQKESDL